MHDKWRRKPLAQAVLSACCALMLTGGSGAAVAQIPYHNLDGGALPIPNANWVQAGAATGAVNGNNMLIQQQSQRAILHWDSFNIGRDNSVQFQQPSAGSVALNRVLDGSPSQIFGQLKANGGVYLINRNGILFGADAKVNVHSLMASTLDVSSEQFNTSVLQNAANNGQAALNGGPDMGSITIEQGANIATDSGGQVLVFAPEVVNRGDISTPDGQAVLAASKDKVYLAGSDKDPDLRGLLVEVDTGGNVTNLGTIIAERGNITLAGLAVNQHGRVRATTSVDVNGSIRLQARDRATLVTPGNAGLTPEQLESLFLDKNETPSGNSRIAIAQRSGTVTFGSGSVTEVAADEATGADGKTKTAVDAQPQNKSRIDVMGQTIELQTRSLIRAKSGKVNLVATTTPAAPSLPGAPNDSRIVLGRDSVIDVSGEHVELPMERRIVEVELRGDELKDSPLQRNGILRGQKVKVDIGKGTPLVADLKPTLAKIQKGLKERSVAGGTVSLRSQGGVVFGDNATIDNSGGSIRYAGGVVTTTKLWSNGRVIDIGDADPNRRYDAIFGEHVEEHTKWGKLFYGQSSLFSKGTYRDGFVEGQAGGELSIVSQLLYGLDLANLRAGTTVGLNQRVAGAMPKGAVLNILLGQGISTETASVQQTVIDKLARSAALGLNDPLTGAEVLYVSADRLAASGFGEFNLRSNGGIQVNEGVDLKLAPGAGISLTGTELTVAGRITAPGGSIKLNTVGPVGGDNGNGNFPLQLTATSKLDVSGSWLNDLLGMNQNATAPLPLLIDGGRIDVAASGDLTVAAGARLLADGGARLNGAALDGGDGGAIALASRGRDLLDTGSRLRLEGELSALGFGRGGNLRLEANAIQVGGSSADPNTLVLDSGFFQRGGFGDYALVANMHGVEVLSNTIIELRQHNRLIDDLQLASQMTTGANLNDFSRVALLPAYQRAPVNLRLELSQTANRLAQPGYLRVDTGARILGETGAKLTLVSDQDLYLDGVLSAPGGAIELALTAPARGAVEPGYRPEQSIWLGSGARLLAGADFVRRPNVAGLAVDDVWDAGSITLRADRGAIVAEPGSVLDVSGASFTVDQLVPSLFGRIGNVRTTVNAAAGRIDFTAAEALVVFSELRGFGAGADGRSGSLSFQLDGNRREEGNGFPYADLELLVMEQLPEWDAALTFGDVLPTTWRNTALVSAATVRAGGFGSLALAAANKVGFNGNLAGMGRIVFTDDIALTLADTLALASTQIELDDHRVSLRAGNVKVGRDDIGEDGDAPNNLVLQQFAAPITGTGRLDLTADFIELVGNIAVGGAEQTRLTSTHDIRARSVIDGLDRRRLAAASFTTPGDLVLQAAQIYPATLADYTFHLTGADSVFTTLGGGSRAPLLSASGRIAVKAPVIEHGGVIAAPLGSIEFDAAQRIHLTTGSLLDVSADRLIPFGRLRGGDISWIYPVWGEQPLLVDKPPEKSVLLKAPATQMDAGAVVDLSGGGDIYAFEHVPGPGGSKDFLDPAYNGGAFAVVPWLDNLTAPYDFLEMQSHAFGIGDIVHLGAAAGLPAGNYAVLPAHYALLPGAYLVTPTGGGALPGLTGTRIDGTPLASGRFGRAYSGQYDSQWTMFAVETGAAARLRSEYTEYTGDEFFNGKPVDRAADAGRMVIEVATELGLDGVIAANSQNGRGAQLDIIADQIAVVDGRSETALEPGVVQLDAGSLSRLGVDSLLLGGRRSRAGADTAIDVLSETVTVRAGAALTAPDVILAARERVAVEAGASVLGAGTSKAAPGAYLVEGDGALLRASAAAQTDVKRTASAGNTGVLDIAAGAVVGADQSILLDATADMQLNGRLALETGSLNLTANRISLGETADGAATNGIALDNADLAALNVQTLRLSSRSSIDFYGDVDFTSGRAELNAGGLRGVATGDVRVVASDTLQLQNTIGAAEPTAADSTGTLTLAARTLVLGDDKAASSAMAVSGFDRVQLGAEGITGELRGAGALKLSVDSAVAVRADRITGATGADTQLLASGAVDMAKAGATQVAATGSALGAKLTVSGSELRHATLIDLPSGAVSLRAETGDVVLAADAGIDVSGRRIAVPNGGIDTAGGSVELSADTGDVIAETGATVRLDGGGNRAGNGAAAGNLRIDAAQGSALWQAQLSAVSGAGRGDQRGGSLNLDVGSIDDLGDWLVLASGAGFDRAIAVRARQGDLTVAHDIAAGNIDIAADTGNLTVAALMNVGGKNGGQIELNAGGDLVLAANARLDAAATATDGRGGRVRIGSSDGTLRFEQGSAITVAGNGEGRDGQVNLRAPRRAGNDEVAVVDGGLRVDGAERIELEGFSVYASTVVDDALLGQVRGGADAFMANEAAIRARLNLAAHEAFHLLPGVEVVSQGDLTLNASPDALFGGIDFYGWRFGANGEAGVLTLRAVGDLTIGQSLMDGVRADTGTLAQIFSPLGYALFLGEDAAWDFNLVAGADLDAASTMAVRNVDGDLRIQNGADILTGAGDIRLAAGGDVLVARADSAIASLGFTPYRDYDSPFADDGFPATERLPGSGTFNGVWAFMAGVVMPQYPIGGGDVAISAGRDVRFQESTQFFSDWIERLGGKFSIDSGASTNPVRSFDLTTWGIMLEHFQQGVAAFGGGNVQVAAGRDVVHLNAALPVTGKQVGVDANEVELLGGGDLTVTAGRDILSPRLLVDRGEAALTAGGNIAAAAGGLQALAALGDSRLSLSARGSVGVDAVFNSTVMPRSRNQTNGLALNESYFFTYGDNSAVILESLVGDVWLSNDRNTVLGKFIANFAPHLSGGAIGVSDEQRLFALYPGRLEVAAASGDIDVRDDLILFPSATGQLALQAGGAILSSRQNAPVGGITLLMSDTDPAGLPTPLRPADRLASANANLDTVMQRLSFGSSAKPALVHAPRPVHSDDREPSVIAALGGDIGDDTVLTFIVPEPTRVYASRDITRAYFRIQHSSDRDVSEIVAGRDILSPIRFNPNTGVFETGVITTINPYTIAGPGRLDVIAGRDIDLGGARGFESIGNQENPFLPDFGADMTFLVGINGASALTDPVLFNQFVDSYLRHAAPLEGSFIDWFGNGGYEGDIVQLVAAFTGSSYADDAAALAAFKTLPTLTRHAIGLEAYRWQRAEQLGASRSIGAYRQLNGFADSYDYAADLIDFVSLDRFGGDLRGAVSAVTGQSYASNAEAAAALALMPVRQQQAIALTAFTAADAAARRELVMEVLFAEVRQGGIENSLGLIEQAERDGFARSRTAIETLFPGDRWQGDLRLAFSGIRSLDDGDINFFVPGGAVDVGLAGNFAGFNKESGLLGIISQRYGAINGVAHGDININQSRIFALDGADITLWSSTGDIDAGRGAKTALTIPPPIAVQDPLTGAISLEFPPAVSGSGIQTARNVRKQVFDRGPLLLSANGEPRAGGDSRTSRQRWFRSLAAGDVYLFAPEGAIDAGDAGIQVDGNIFLDANEVIGTDNIDVGGISIGVPTTTSISAATLSLGDTATAATEGATQSLGEAMKDAATALAEGGVAFVTVDIIGIGQ